MAKPFSGCIKFKYLSIYKYIKCSAKFSGLHEHAVGFSFINHIIKCSMETKHLSEIILVELFWIVFLANYSLCLRSLSNCL